MNYDQDTIHNYYNRTFTTKLQKLLENKYEIQNGAYGQVVLLTHGDKQYAVKIANLNRYMNTYKHVMV